MRLLALTLLALGLARVAGAAAPGMPEFVPGRVVVRYRADSESARRLVASAGRPDRTGLAPAGVDAATGAALEWLIPPRGLGAHFEEARAAGLARTVRLTIPQGVDAAAAARDLATRADVEWAYPVRLLPLATAAAALPDDPALASQWHHDFIGSPTAWERTTGDPSVVMGIIDTGVDLHQVDLVPTLWTNQAELDGLPGVDDDGNGYIDDVHGFDFTDVPEIDGAGDFTVRDGDPQDDVGHGTWVAGAACAAGDNGIGGAGVAYGCRLMALRAGFRPRNGLSLGYLAEDDAAAAIVYAVENGARIVNLSFGDLVRAPILEDAVRFAIDRGVLVVAAAGNAGTSQPFYPAALSGVLAVGASDRDGERASFSSFGNDVRLLAPGASIVTTELTDAGGGVTSKSGTSLASPLAAGAAALLMSAHPDWSAGKIFATLEDSARPGRAGSDLKGARLLNVGDAIGAEGQASILLPGLEDGQGVDQQLVVRGNVQGRGVRGWRVSLRRTSTEAWRTLAEAAHGAAYDDTLVVWDATAEPEGDAILRVEALGVDQVVKSHEVALRVDHTPPVVTNVTALPIVSGDGYGFRVASRTDDEALGSVRLGDGDSTAAMVEIVGTDYHVLGLNGPFTPGQPLSVEMTMTNRANLSTRQRVDLFVPQRSVPAFLAQHADGPPLISLLPRVIDLNGDGIPEIVGEELPAGGQNYGRVVAYSPTETGPGGPTYSIAWEDTQTYLPQDVGDFDGDGRPDILGLGFQETRVYTAGPPGSYPSRLGWRTLEAWASHFIPSADGPGLDIVTSRDDEIRIYSRAGSELVLRQTLANPHRGASITPFIVSGVFEAGGPLCLATIDGDGGLLVYRRGSDGNFELYLSRSLGSDNAGLLAVGDVDGDGVDELALVSAVGEFPSPSDGLRDGYFRLQLFHVSADGLSLMASIGASGYFPGNPVGLAALDVDGDGAREIWWSAGGQLYRLVLEGTELRLDQAWSGVTAARPALWVRSAAEGGSRLIYPGDIRAGGVTPGAWFGGSAAVAADPRALGLRVTKASRNGDLVDLELSWSEGGDASLTRTREGTPGPATNSVATARMDVTGGSVPDTGLESGATYRYTLTPAGSARVADSLIVLARPDNPIRTVTRTAGYILAEWTWPLQALEGATVSLFTSAGEPTPSVPIYPTLDREGRRLLIGLPPGLESGAYQFRLSRYISDSNLPLRDQDARFDLPALEPAPLLTLRRATAVDASHVRLVIEPAAPPDPAPGSFIFTPAATASRATAIPGGVELEFAQPLPGGAWSVRLDPGLTGSAGERVQPGEGDAIAFRVGPLVYPNPVTPAGTVHFDGVTPGARIYIYDLTGRTIWSATSDAAGSARWDGAGLAGSGRSPGVYLYRVEGDATLHGKIAVKG